MSASRETAFDELALVNGPHGAMRAFNGFVSRYERKIFVGQDINRAMKMRGRLAGDVFKAFEHLGEFRGTQVQSGTGCAGSR